MLKTLSFQIVILSLIFTSCSIVYYPNRINAPLLSSENEFVGNAAVGANGIDIQAAYSVNSFLALQFSGNTYYKNNEYEKNNHQYLDFGFGYYKKTDRIFKYEIFGGVGIGRGDDKKFYEGTVDDYANGYYYKIFVQPNVGLSNDFFDLIFSARVSNLNFYNYQSKYTGIRMNGIYEREFENGPFLFNTLFFEPAITAGLGYKFVKANAQIGFALPLYVPTFDYNPFIMNLGLQFKIKSKTITQ